MLGLFKKSSFEAEVLHFCRNRTPNERNFNLKLKLYNVLIGTYSLMTWFPTDFVKRMKSLSVAYMNN